MTHKMKFIFLSLFSQAMQQFFLKGLIGKACDAGCFEAQFLDLRTYSDDKHHRVDDYPYGHTQGMILKADVISRAIRSIDQYQTYRLLYTCPKGPALTHEVVTELKSAPGIIILPGYYEGVDERVFSLFPFQRVSVGDVILSSGELPSMMIADAIIRQLPGVLGNAQCVAEESFMSGLLESPQYTYPREVMGAAVPEVLLNGHHAAIATWRRRAALNETLRLRPDLLVNTPLTDDDKMCIIELLKEDGCCDTSHH